MDVHELSQQVEENCSQILLNKNRTDSVSIKNTQRMIQSILNDIGKVREMNASKADALTADVLTKTCMYKADMDIYQQDKTYLNEHVPGRTLSSKVVPMGGRKRRTKRHRSKKSL
jgi:hypothetical protein